MEIIKILMIVCTVVDDSNRLDLFSRGKFVILFDDKKKEILFKEENPALNSSVKRPLVARECVRLKAETVIAAHGSLCYPSHSILKKANVKMLVGNIGDSIYTNSFYPVTRWEVVYSSFLAIKERLFGH
ncbi:hypothetical protein GFS03_12750 [Sulfolobus sp. E5-1-F]|uniref:NifB/NifX family molybdenum-iron cluster-binding protein n=1 Tax=Sulfolobaceae TaxID=118883 RepID=UPI00129752C4|nr:MULTISPECIES: hypothetical protein [unclassified Sulfolobus]QGA55378.1 hypothetical protein GFS03_12750 [Sulfolobus sp. E5-1-F]QGA68150.1 hypothetical protein GFS33_04640 [Sulfolobus sp. E11-6]